MSAPQISLTVGMIELQAKLVALKLAVEGWSRSIEVNMFHSLRGIDRVWWLWEAEGEVDKLHDQVKKAKEDEEEDSGGLSSAPEKLPGLVDEHTVCHFSITVLHLSSTVNVLKAGCLFSFIPSSQRDVDRRLKQGLAHSK